MKDEHNLLLCLERCSADAFRPSMFGHLQGARDHPWAPYVARKKREAKQLGRDTENVEKNMAVVSGLVVYYPLRGV